MFLYISSTYLVYERTCIYTQTFCTLKTVSEHLFIHQSVCLSYFKEYKYVVTIYEYSHRLKCLYVRERSILNT